MPPFRRLLVVACWLAVLVAYVAAILPQADAPHLARWDKLNHMAAFLVIGLLARLAYPRSSAFRLLAWASLFGALIEVSQAVPLIGRDAELADWVADVAAAITGVALGAVVLRLVRR